MKIFDAVSLSNWYSHALYINDGIFINFFMSFVQFCTIFATIFLQKSFLIVCLMIQSAMVFSSHLSVNNTIQFILSSFPFRRNWSQKSKSKQRRRKSERLKQLKVNWAYGTETSELIIFYCAWKWKLKTKHHFQIQIRHFFRDPSHAMVQHVHGFWWNVDSICLSSC